MGNIRKPIWQSTNVPQTDIFGAEGDEFTKVGVGNFISTETITPQIFTDESNTYGYATKNIADAFGINPVYGSSSSVEDTLLQAIMIDISNSNHNIYLYFKPDLTPDTFTYGGNVLDLTLETPEYAGGFDEVIISNPSTGGDATLDAIWTLLNNLTPSLAEFPSYSVTKHFKKIEGSWGEYFKPNEVVPIEKRTSTANGDPILNYGWTIVDWNKYDIKEPEMGWGSLDFIIPNGTTVSAGPVVDALIGITESGGGASIGGGINNRIAGAASLVIGQSNITEGDNTLVWGGGNYAGSSGSGVGGYYNVCESLFSLVAGQRCNSTSSTGYNLLVGQYLDSNTNHEVVFGRYNIQAVGASLVIGSGSGTSSRENSFVLYNNGVIDLPHLNVSNITSVKHVTTKEYVDAAVAKGGSTRPIDPTLYTQFWDTNITKLIVCTDNTNGANVWNDTAGVVV